MTDSDWEELEQPGSRLAERVLVTVRRRRRALVLAAAVLMLPALVLTAVLVVSRGRGRAAPPPARTDDRVSVYLAVIRDEGRDVYLADSLPRAVRQAIRRGVRTAVYFGAPSGIGGPSVIVLSALHVHGATAELSRAYQCGTLCTSGATLHLARRDGRWKITSREPAWVS